MERSLIIFFYFIIAFLLIRYFSNYDNLNIDNTIKNTVEKAMFDDIPISFPNSEKNESIIRSDVEDYKKLQDRRHAMILEHIKRQSITNSHILQNQSYTTSTTSAVKTIYDNPSYFIPADTTSYTNLDDIVKLISGESCLISVAITETGIDSSIEGGYIGKYINSRMKTDIIYSVEHEINNSVNFKGSFETDTGNLKIINLTSSDITLTVVIKSLELV